jgi:hypothetical protein
MKKGLEPAFIEQLQKAADRGQVVVIPPPATPPLRDRDKASLAAALCLLFELSRSEGQMLAKLMLCDYCTQEELHIAANHDNQKVALSSVRVLICMMRKKLATYHGEITALHKLGYGLRKGSREKIYRLLAKHDAGFITATPPPEGQAAPPKRRARTDQELPAE